MRAQVLPKGPYASVTTIKTVMELTIHAEPSFLPTGSPAIFAGAPVDLSCGLLYPRRQFGSGWIALYTKIAVAELSSSN